MAVEDSATLAECVARAATGDQLPLAMQVYETIRKPRAEKMKAASEYSGVEKHFEDGEEQRNRDDRMRAALIQQTMMINKVEQNRHPSAWIVGHDVLGSVSICRSGKRIF